MLAYLRRIRVLGDAAVVEQVCLAQGQFTCTIDVTYGISLLLVDCRPKGTYRALKRCSAPRRKERNQRENKETKKKMRQAAKIAPGEDGTMVLKNRTSTGVKWRYISMLIDIEDDESELVELVSVMFIESMLR